MDVRKVYSKQEAVTVSVAYEAGAHAKPLFLELLGEFWTGGRLDQALLAGTLEAIRRELSVEANVESQVSAMTGRARIKLAYRA